MLFVQETTSHRDPEVFKMCLDLNGFSPEEISIKIKYWELVIKGKHEDKLNGYFLHMFN
jgi:HSP20 family molecular chaperone IbpA